jgi:hypothetical protein
MRSPTSGGFRIQVRLFQDETNRITLIREATVAFGADRAAVVEAEVQCLGTAITTTQENLALEADAVMWPLDRGIAAGSTMYSFNTQVGSIA